MAKKKTNKEFVKEIFELVGYEYIFLEEYVNSTTKIKCKHIIEDCNHEWYILPPNFLRGRRCPNCFGKIQKTNEQFLKEVYNLTGDEYTFLEEYIDNKTQIRCRHNECNNEWNITPDSFLRGTRCPVCQHRSYKKTTEEFVQEVFDLEADDYQVLGEYVNGKTKIEMKHNQCGCTWGVMPINFLKGTRCPECSLSRGETAILKWLSSRNIQYISQHTFDNCRDLYPLPFDFYLPSYNLLIEYDGTQHFEPVEYFGGEKKFKDQQYKDNIKNEYCNKQNIKLLRIPYWDFDNIEQILNNELKVGEEECRKIS